MNNGPPVFQANQPLFPQRQDSTSPTSTQTTPMSNVPQTQPGYPPQQHTSPYPPAAHTNYPSTPNPYQTPQYTNAPPTTHTPSYPAYTQPTTPTSPYGQAPSTPQYGAPPTFTSPFQTTSQPNVFTPGPPTMSAPPTSPPLGPPPTSQPNMPPQGPPPGFTYTPLNSISTGGAQPYPTTTSTGVPHSRYPYPTQQPGAPQQPAQPGKVEPVKTSPRGSEQKINPSQVPSPTNINPNASSKYYTRANAIPPSVATHFTSYDEGNSNPRFMRMTTYTLPSGSDIQKSSHLPVSFVLQPFADLGKSEESVPLVDFGPTGPIRCQRCKAYINPFVTFMNGGQSYKCKICDFINDVPREYFSPLDPNGKRHDLSCRPELIKGTVDFVATAEYMEKAPTSPAYLFAIDVSYNSVSSGVLQLFIESIKRILHSWPMDPNTRIGFVTYDTTIHFYNLNPSLTNPQMMVVPDIESVFVPLSEEVIFVRYAQAQTVVDTLLSKIPTMFANTKITDSCFGAVLQAGLQSLTSNGGKVIAFQSILPSVGPGKLVKRDDQKALGTDREKALYQPHDTFYTSLAPEFVKGHVGLDLFLMPTTGFVDVATLSVVPKATGGQVYYYPGFLYNRDAEKFYHELYRNLTRTTAFDGILRVRAGRGLSVNAHYGNFYTANELELQFATMDSDKSILVDLKYDDKLDEKTETLIQVALLYTTSNAQRRIRVFNAALPASSILGNLFRGADLDSVLNYLLRTILSEVTKKEMSALRASLMEQSVNILYSYRKYCATSSSAGQLILPEALKLLPIYTLAMLKNAVMRPGTDVLIDERAYLHTLVNSMPVNVSNPFLYPRMFALHELPSDVGTPLDEEGNVKLPPLVRLSSELLSSDGAFLVEDGQKMFLWIGKTNHMNPQHLDESVQTVIAAIRKERTSYPQLFVIRQGEPTELKFFSYLVEDKALDAMNYVDFLCHVHRQIQGKLA